MYIPKTAFFERYVFLCSRSVVLEMTIRNISVQLHQNHKAEREGKTHTKRSKCT